MEPPDLPDKPAASRSSAFRRRAMSTLVLWVIIAGALALQSSMLFAVVIVLIGTLAFIEFLGLLKLEGSPGWAGIRWGLTVLAACYLGAVAMHCKNSVIISPEDSDSFLLLLTDSLCLPAVVIITTFLLLFHPINGNGTKDMFFGVVFGFVYTVILSSFLLRVLYIEGDYGNDYLIRKYGSGMGFSGQYYLLFLLVVTKFSDMGGYIVGSLIGRHKMIPHISPGKTWEGFTFGCLVFSVAGGCAVYALFGEHMPLLNWTHVIILGFLLGILAVVGDLAESIVKRCLARKDSGQVLPGIGGVLDLVDSILFTAPVLFLYLIALS
ncbi:MAG: CDP-archaeol synthase [Verrucomicrobiaceae bacterium]|nr:CDP-archaeol synthase [Verrucomicrobiaceae bacterium]